MKTNTDEKLTIDSKENKNSNEKEDKKKLSEEFLKTVNSKLKKNEKDIWYVTDHEPKHPSS